MNELSGESMAYDLGARFYDARLGRMFSIDPLAAQYPWQSPYAYCNNSPVSCVDIKGMGGGDEVKPMKQTYDWGAGNHTSSINNSSKGTVLLYKTGEVCLETNVNISYSSFNNYLKINNIVQNSQYFKSNIEQILAVGISINFTDINSFDNDVEGAFTYKVKSTFNIYSKDFSKLDPIILESKGIDPIFEELYHMINCFKGISGYYYDEKLKSFVTSNSDKLNEEARAKFQVVSNEKVQIYYAHSLTDAFSVLADKYTDFGMYIKNFTSYGVLVGKSELEIMDFITNNKNKTHSIKYYYIYYDTYKLYHPHNKQKVKKDEDFTISYPQQGRYDYLCE